MATRYWGYAGPQGQAGPVSTDELALFLRERLIGVDTLVCPVEGMQWAPLSHWLPELAPFGARRAADPFAPLPASRPTPPLPAPVPSPVPAPVQSLAPQAAPQSPQYFTPPPETPFALAPPSQPLPTEGWTDRKPHPWRRYWARMLDIAIMGWVTAALLGLIGAVVAPEPTKTFLAFLADEPLGKLADLLLTILLAIPGNALLLGLTGGTPGKWLFGVKVVRPDGRPIGILPALWREIRVWFQGMGMGIPLISLFTLFAGYSWLVDDGRAPWDKPRRRVALHRPGGAWQVLLMLVGLALLVGIRVWVAMPIKPGA